MLYFVPTPIGNLEDISMRALKVLKSAEIVFCEDTRVTKKLLSLLSKKFEITFKNKDYFSLHSHNEKYVLSKMQLFVFDKEVVYLSDAGMPCISDPGCELVRFCQKHSIPYEVLPGANALLTAFASSGFCDPKFLFFGFLPHKGKDRDNNLKKALYSGYTSILYESPHRLKKLLTQINSLDKERELFLIKEATKLYETKYKGKAKEILDNLKDENIKGEWVVVIEAGGEKIEGQISKEDILSLNIPKKEASKLLAKLYNISPKECYNLILKENN